MRRALTIAPVALLFAAGCLASKNDIVLLQNELVATRGQLSQGDSAILRAEEARRMQINQLSMQIDRAMDSLRSVATRLANFQATATGNFDAINQQMLQMQAILGQTTRNLQEQRTQLQALREQGMSMSAPPAASAPVTTADPGAPAASPALPGAATLYEAGRDALGNSAFTTARRSFEQLVSAYPADPLAPTAMLRIGESYKGEGRVAESDSVYRSIVVKYPKAEEAATGLYRVGKSLWDAGKRTEARPILQRVLKDYPNSDAAVFAKEILNPRE